MIAASAARCTHSVAAVRVVGHCFGIWPAPAVATSPCYKRFLRDDLDGRRGGRRHGYLRAACLRALVVPLASQCSGPPSWIVRALRPRPPPVLATCQIWGMLPEEGVGWGRRIRQRSPRPSAIPQRGCCGACCEGRSADGGCCCCCQGGGGGGAGRAS